MWFLAAAWVLLELTDSPAWVGLIGLTALPAILLSIFGGGLADRTPRARLLVFGAAGYSAVFGVTALLVQFDVHNEWQILGMSLVLGAFWAFQTPAMKAVVVELVDRNRLTTANALSEFAEFAGEIVAPLIVGFLIVASGASSVFWLAFTLLLLELALFASLPQAPQAGPRDGSGLLGELRGGFRYMMRTPPFAALLVISFAGLFGSMLIPLVPVVARDTLNAGASGFGVLSAALGVGLAAGSVILLMAGEKGRRIIWLLFSTVFASCGTIAFAYSDLLWIAALALFLVGLGTAVTGNMVVTLFQVSASDTMRGRSMGVYSVASAMVPLGSVIGGWLGAALSVEAALLISAVAMFAPVVLATVSSPTLRRM